MFWLSRYPLDMCGLCCWKLCLYYCLNKWCCLAGSVKLIQISLTGTRWRYATVMVHPLLVTQKVRLGLVYFCNFETLGVYSLFGIGSWWLRVLHIDTQIRNYSFFTIGFILSWVLFFQNNYIQQKGSGLFFRGQIIWEAIMDELLSIGMSKAKQVKLLPPSNIFFSFKNIWYFYYYCK